MGSLSDYLNQTPDKYDPNNAQGGGVDANGYFHDPSGYGTWAMGDQTTPGAAYGADNPDNPAQGVNPGLPNYQQPTNGARPSSVVPGEGPTGKPQTQPPPGTPSPTGTNDGGTPPAPGQVNTNGAPAAPIDFTGQQPVQQATTLYNALKQYGVNLSDFVVGGNSPYDTQIMQQINVINNPNSPDAQKRAAAQTLQSLASMRASTATGDGRMRVINGVAQPITTQTPTDMIKGMYNPADPYGKGSAAPTQAFNDFMKGSPTFKNQDTENASMTGLMNGGNSHFSGTIDDLINQLSQGGVTPEMEQVAMSQLLENSGNSDAAARQQTADSLAANGIQGGAMVDALSRQTQADNANKDNAMSNLKLGILQQQLSSKQNALQDIFSQESTTNQASAAGLSAYLQQAGLDWNSAQSLAQMLMQEQANQASAASNYSGQQTGYALQQRGQDMTMIMHLADLAQAGDQNAKNLLQQLLGSLYGGTAASSYSNVAGS